MVTNGGIRCAKLQSNCHHQQTNTQLFTGWMPSLSPNQRSANLWRGIIGSSEKRHCTPQKALIHPTWPTDKNTPLVGSAYSIYDTTNAINTVFKRPADDLWLHNIRSRPGCYVSRPGLDLEANLHRFRSRMFGLSLKLSETETNSPMPSLRGLTTCCGVPTLKMYNIGRINLNNSRFHQYLQAITDNGAAEKWPILCRVGH